jgi:hypothetical protein
MRNQAGLLGKPFFRGEAEVLVKRKQLFHLSGKTYPD